MLTAYQKLRVTEHMGPFMPICYQESISLQCYIEHRLKPTWDWLLTIMDATETQLRFGASLTHLSDPAHPSHPLHITPAQGKNVS